MGLTKQYLAYRPVGNFNIIASSRPNINFVIYNKTDGRHCIVGGAENVILWDLRLGQKVLEFRREKQEVTALRASPDRMHIAVGYIDGVVEIFDIESAKSVCSLALHKTAITILRYDNMGIRLISGSMDTELVVIDIISELGKHRLIGHNAPVTDAHFLDDINSDICISSSKDTQIKFWDLQTQTCFKTLVDNRTEVWGLALVGELLIAGNGENTMNVYKITKKDSREIPGPVVQLIEGLSLDDEDIVSPINVVNCGIIQRAGKGRTVSLVADSTGRVLSCHGTNDLIENFYICSKNEAIIRLKKRLKKSTENTIDSSTEKLSNELTLSDEIKRLPSIKIGNKVKSIDIAIGLNDELRIIINCGNNTLQLHSLDMSNKKSSDTTLLRSITQCGHHSEVRTVCFSSDSLAIASGSGESMKLWNQNSLQSLKTIPTDYILCSCFVPGDRHVLLGMKNGNLLIIDIGTGEILEQIPAHKEEIWSICLLPDLKGCVTGSSDSTVKIWSFELIESPSEEISKIEKDENFIVSPKPSILSLLHKNTLKLEETVLCVKVSPNGKFLAAGLLDSTVKIFFLDSFKFYVSLYGHKLPVLCMDISDDSTLIVTGSGDRNIKIWGLDFGDCHRSLFAHDDSVVSIQFIPKTHLYFSCGKDGKIKQWDADSFEKIVTLPGHIGQAYNLAVSPNGKLLITCGSDRTLRLFERTDETIVLQDIQEQEREEMENQLLATGDNNEIPTHPGLKLPSRKTVGSEKAAESILECLEICKTFVSENDDELHPLMIAYDVKNIDDFLMIVFQRIRPADLEEALLLLPFSDVCEILQRIPKLAENRKDQTELILKITLFILRIHHKPIVSNHTLVTVIGKIRKTLEELTIELRDMIGINLYAFQMLQRSLEENDGIELFTDASRQKKQRDKQHKKRELQKRLHIQMS